MKLISIVTSLVIAIGVNTSMAQTDNSKGLEIMTEVDVRDEGFEDFKAQISMVLEDNDGNKSTRLMEVKNLEVKDDGDKRLLVFKEPSDVSGTALLTYSHILEDDEQWLFLPALKRVKRISSSNKSGPFVGSEFAYEDMLSQEVEKYDYSYIGEEVINGQDCYVIERKPRYESSGYNKQKVWVDKEHFRYQKIEYYDHQDAHLKTLVLSDYQQFLNKYWRAKKMVMTNHQTQKSTAMYWKQFSFRNGYDDSSFTKSVLKRSR
ncbi:outer membrane lipoprotein-sorting protein [Kangiella sediminilitoris]|uniref:Outer membrane lipoprotein-sorting protein n=1 Tax=Kangiella sediminilitoris TaxID=1144748 RepID=A0A1B3B947_9GAMM|nr:outer membrane lipoprotein-sorting protein [Kangiella sediminilitoris]AOE49305.1 Outer membrane lipoprotein-sorting protein [Kangiella sediminilitoris]